MLRQPSVFNQLMSSRCCAEEAGDSSFPKAAGGRSSFDLRLARRLPDKQGAYQYCDSRSAERAIEILDETSRGQRLLPILGHLVHSGDAAACRPKRLFLGRRLQNPEWAARQLKKDDVRVRANAVEWIWGLQSLARKRFLNSASWIARAGSRGTRWWVFISSAIARLRRRSTYWCAIRTINIALRRHGPWGRIWRS